MSEIFQKIKVPIIIVAVLFLAFIGYNVFIKKDSTAGIVVAPASSAVTATADKDILPLLLKIKDITFDSTFFDDPSYKSLKDAGQEIKPEDSGRANPFSETTYLGSSSGLEGPSFNSENATTTGVKNTGTVKAQPTVQNPPTNQTNPTNTKKTK